jgi:predicted enzyme related to lactoylglutathione lyase
MEIYLMKKLKAPCNGPGDYVWQYNDLRCSVRCLAAVLLLAMFMLTGCTAGKQPSSLVLTPVTEAPTGIHHQGKFVWNDLLTSDAATARDFYGQLFGWTFTQQGRYTVIRNNDRNIGGIVQLKGDPDNPSAARWLSLLSVADVDQAAALVKTEGGAVHIEPTEVPNRGRVALVSDPQGAKLVLLQARDGDPEDEEPAIGSWLWHELWSNNAEASLTFYQKLAGYDYENYEGEADDYLILIREDQWRAGIRFIDDSELEMRWVPVVRVADTEAVAQKAEHLGGEIRVAPRPTESGSVALLVDPSGARVIIQSWTAPAAEQEDGS